VRRAVSLRQLIYLLRKISVFRSFQTVLLSVCPVLSVTLVYCGQTVRRIKVKLGMNVGLSPGHTALDGDPALRTEKGHSSPLPIFEIYGRMLFASVRIIRGPCLLSPNGWMDQDAAWYIARPQPRPHYVRWGPSFSCPKGHSPHFSPHACCGQTARWIKMPRGKGR